MEEMMPEHLWQTNRSHKSYATLSPVFRPKTHKILFVQGLEEMMPEQLWETGRTP
jgi:hypothetical protein